MDGRFPLLEFDENREAIIEPSSIAAPLDVPQNCVICFFKEVIDKVVKKHSAKVVAGHTWEDGPHPLYEIVHSGRRLAFYHPGVGSALSAGLLEEVIAFGCRKFIACGGCGVLEKDMQVGKVIVVSAAVRDEGVSYHYLPASREASVDRKVIEAMTAVLEKQGVPFLLGKTWTTDAPFRETRGKTTARKKEGCLTVEMEAAAMIAVAEFRGVRFGQILYAGDDLSGEVWNDRGWRTRPGIREKLFWLAADMCLEL